MRDWVIVVVSSLLVMAVVAEVLWVAWLILRWLAEATG